MPTKQFALWQINRSPMWVVSDGGHASRYGMHEGQEPRQTHVREITEELSTRIECRERPSYDGRGPVESILKRRSILTENSVSDNCLDAE